MVWLLEWLKEKLKVEKAYYNADPNRQPIQLALSVKVSADSLQMALVSKFGGGIEECM